MMCRDKTTALHCFSSSAVSRRLITQSRSVPSTRHRRKRAWLHRRFCVSALPGEPTDQRSGFPPWRRLETRSLQQHRSRVVNERKTATTITVVIALSHNPYRLFQLEQSYFAAGMSPETEIYSLGQLLTGAGART